MNTQTTSSIALFGAAPDTGNQGVTALCYSVIDGLARRNVGPLTVFDHGFGRRAGYLSLSNAKVGFERMGAINGRRYYRPENLTHMRLAARAGGLWNAPAKTLCRARAVLDVSGGDSFTEIYGKSRFKTVTLPKRIALDTGRPLVLLPQTYGPFYTRDAREQAKDIVRRARMAWARDEASFGELKKLLGDAFDPTRHRSGVDMAFGLPACPPREPLAEPISSWLEANNRTRPVLGFNVSGLLYRNPLDAAVNFGLRGDYCAIVHATLRRLLANTNARIILVPHVYVGKPESECDLAACEHVLQSLDADPDRIEILRGEHNAMALKWAVSRMDWFCGTRMHATIAGLSSGVPTIALAYSGKTQGVFETCGLGSAVTDLRQADGEAVRESILESWRQRETTRAHLARAIPGVKARAMSQMDAIASAVAGNMEH